ncbi:MAG: class I SAM-dependent methyltransferase [Candidatus Riflebacteria bacterium]|nr:class I SAM-dependent methyltransferase [Candidatus Riflebacteria bacterium]
MTQKVDEWLQVKSDSQYHDSQFLNPYKSTVAFVQWLMEKDIIKNEISEEILDVGCGKGANIFYLNKKFPNTHFSGMDINQELIDEGNMILQKHQMNSKLEVGDLYKENSSYLKRFDGIVSFQTLSWLPDFREPILSFSRMAKNWIAMTSLFFDGDLNCTIKVEDHNRKQHDGKPSEYFYNVYSLNLISEHLRNCGFPKLSYCQFEIDIDLERTNPKGIGTYTEKLLNGRRIQFSGPLHLPWYFILAEK